MLAVWCSLEDKEKQGVQGSSPETATLALF